MQRPLLRNRAAGRRSTGPPTLEVSLLALLLSLALACSSSPEQTREEPLSFDIPDVSGMPIAVPVKAEYPEELDLPPEPTLTAERTADGLVLTFDRIDTCARYGHVVTATKNALWLTVHIVDEPGPAAVSGSFRCMEPRSSRLRVTADVGDDIQHVRLLDRDGALLLEIDVPPAGRP